MKKTICMALAIMMVLCLFAGCGGETEVIPTPEVTPEATPEAIQGVGVYSFTEIAMNGALEIPFTVELKADGSFTITEANPMKGEIVYSGDSFEWSDRYFTTGAFTAEAMPEAGWFNADGSCVWIITGEGTVIPMSYAEPEIVRTTEYSDIPYAGDSSAQVLDVYLPEAEGTYPVIVVVHGGGFKFGDEGMNIIKPIFAATERGYAVVSIDYRKSGEAPFPAALADTKAAVRWVRANADFYGFDAENIAIWGESAGAYLSLMTALTPEVSELNGDVDENLEYSSAVQALVDFYGPVDFWELDADAVSVGIDASFGKAGSFESDFVGQAVGADEEFTRKTWWGTYTEQLPADFALKAWIQVGNADHRVPYPQSENFAAELAPVIGEENVTFGIIDGADHEDSAFYTEDNLAAVYAFLDSVLK